MHDNKEFILRAEKSGFRIWQLQDIWFFPKFLTAHLVHLVSYSKGKLLSFLRYTGKGFNVTTHFHLMQVLWICGSKIRQTWFRTTYLSTGLNPLEIFYFLIFFLWIFALLIHLKDKISNSSYKLSYQCRICANNGMENF
jgi:hypothetical protein